MKKTIYTLIILLAGIITTFAQSPLGFNYQSVIRDADGTVLADTEIDMRISIVQSTIDGTSVYTETHQATTNAFGLVNLVIGQGTTVSGEFATINWGADNYFLNVEIDINNSGTFTEIGTTQLLSVPYANYAFTSGSSGDGWVGADQSVSTNKNVGIGTDAPTSKLQIVANEDQKSDEPIFEIKNAAGKTVFAVFENEVKVYIDDATPSPGFTVNKRDAADQTEEIMAVGPQQTNVYVGAGNDKGVLGGFAVSGRTTTKEVENLFTIMPDMTQFFVKETAGKENFGGFAVSGRTTTKGIVDILSITPSLTEFFVDQPTKENFGGFAVSGRTTTKGVAENLLNITPALTKFTVEQPTKENFGGFAVSGRTTTKAEVDILNITPDFTRFYIDEPSSKENFGGFAVSGRTTTKGINDEIFKVTPGLTEVFVNESMVKESFGGFAVSGRTTTKETGLFDIFRVQPHKTEVYIKDSETKNLPERFSIFSLNPALESTELFAVTDEGTFVNTTMTLPPKVTTGDTIIVEQELATFTGMITDSTDQVITNVGFVYSLNPADELTTKMNFLSPAENGIIYGEMQSMGLFIGTADLLLAGKTYYYRAFAINDNNFVGYGEVKSFTTDAPWTLYFNVMNNSSETIPDAVISVRHNASGYVFTNEPGDYTFHIAPDYYSYEVEAPGYYDQSTVLDFLSDGMTHNIVMNPAPPKVRFYIKLPDGTPGQYATVAIVNADLDTSFVYGGEYGVATAYLVNGTYTYIVKQAENFDYTGSVTVAGEDQNIDVTLTPRPTRTVTFNVTYRPELDIIPAVGAFISVNLDGKIYSESLTTDDNGQAVFTNVPEGSYAYYVEFNNIWQGYTPIPETGDQIIDVFLELTPPKSNK